MNVLNYLWPHYTALTVVEVAILTVVLPRKLQRFFGTSLAVLLIVTHVAILVKEPLLFAIPFCFIGIYRAVNVARFAYGRMSAKYLQRATQKSSLILGLFQLLVGLVAILVVQVNATSVWYVGAVIALLLFLYVSAIQSLNGTIKNGSLQPRPLDKPAQDMPSLTVAIPARNETQQLEACITSVLASTYQKLEVLVLDDCSQQRPSDIIKKFAHEGVRFVQGSEPGDSWLAKNAAYEKLLQEANSDYILFCGVDVRLEPQTITLLMQFKLNQKLTMLSVLPIHTVTSNKPSVIQQARYMWELAVPRKLAKRPPVLSTLWIANKQLLQKSGGFASVKRMIVPEAYFAKVSAAKNAYRFIIGTAELGVKSTKLPNEQVQTSLRLRYPQLHKKPQNVLITTCISSLVFFAPIALLIYGVNAKHPLITFFAEVLIAMQFYISWRIAQVTVHYGGLKAILYALISPVADLYMMQWSMLAYEFGSVVWKDRNVCLPVMHVTPRLPPLD